MYTDWQRVADTACSVHRAQQQPTELGVLLTIMDQQLRPGTVLEIGTGSGGSAWAWSVVPSVMRIITIDIVQDVPIAADIMSNVDFRQVVGRSQDPDTLATVLEILDGGYVQMLYVDGAHDYDSVRSDLATYTGLVAPGGLVVMHDTQGYAARSDFNVRAVFGPLRHMHRSLELVAEPNGPGGTGLLWKPS